MGVCVMVCEAGDVVCHVLVWLSDNDFLAADVIKRLGEYWIDNGGILGTIGAVIRDFGQLIIGILGGSLGIWKLYHYREKILHKRLAEYLEDNDSRLNSARNDVLGALVRPGPRRPFSDPIFAGKELRRALSERRWDKSSSMFSTVTSRAISDLDVAIGKIERKIGTVEETLASFHNHLASAHILRGAIAAVSVSQVFNGKKKRDLNTQALNHFRVALHVPGFSKNVEAKEYEAHQLRRIGDFDLALVAYQALESNTGSLEGQRAKDLHVARCRRYRAEILQAKAIQLFRDGNAVTDRTLNAYNLMVSPNSPTLGALTLRNQYASVFQEWDLVEQGDMLFLTAFICQKQEFWGREKHYRSLAETAYERVIEVIPSGKWRLANFEKCLKDAAIVGKKRILDSKDGRYDDNWLLLPSLQKAKNPPQSISSTGSHDSI